jgi:hypothetical protein
MTLLQTIKSPAMVCHFRFFLLTPSIALHGLPSRALARSSRQVLSVPRPQNASHAVRLDRRSIVRDAVANGRGKGKSARVGRIRCPVHTAYCLPRAAVAIEPSLRPQSPENGNIRGVGRRQSAILPAQKAKREGGDSRQARESPPSAGFLGGPGVGTTNAGLTGWGGRIRTSAWWNQNPLRCGLAMRHTLLAATILHNC